MESSRPAKRRRRSAQEDRPSIQPLTPSKGQAAAALPDDSPVTAAGAAAGSFAGPAGAPSHGAPPPGIAPVQLRMAPPPAIRITQPADGDSGGAPGSAGSAPAAAAAQLFAAAAGAPSSPVTGLGTGSVFGPVSPGHQQTLIQLPAGAALCLGDTLIQAVPAPAPAQVLSVPSAVAAPGGASLALPGLQPMAAQPGAAVGAGGAAVAVLRGTPLLGQGELMGFVPGMAAGAPPGPACSRGPSPALIASPQLGALGPGGAEWAAAGPPLLQQWPTAAAVTGPWQGPALPPLGSSLAHDLPPPPGAAAAAAEEQSQSPPWGGPAWGSGFAPAAAAAAGGGGGAGVGREEGEVSSAPGLHAGSSPERLLADPIFPSPQELAAALSLTPSQLAIAPAKTWSINQLLSLPSFGLELSPSQLNLTALAAGGGTPAATPARGPSPMPGPTPTPPPASAGPVTAAPVPTRAGPGAAPAGPARHPDPFAAFGPCGASLGPWAGQEPSRQCTQQQGRQPEPAHTAQQQGGDRGAGLAAVPSAGFAEPDEMVRMLGSGTADAAAEAPAADEFPRDTPGSAGLGIARRATTLEIEAELERAFE